VLENKKVEIDNFKDKAAALKIIEDAVKHYQGVFRNK
jgi:inorganic pyrophosphatase